MSFILEQFEDEESNSKSHWWYKSLDNKHCKGIYDQRSNDQTNNSLNYEKNSFGFQ